MWLIDRIAERRIREAQQQGEFDNLPGEGAPLALDDDALVPAELRAGYRLLKNAGYLPPQLQLRREIDEAGALIAMAHPLTIIGAFFAAPLTSLNPTIGAGMVTAAIEIMLRRPTVEDFSKLRTEAAHFKGWWRNRVTRTLLIFILSSLGSAIGTYVAGYRIFERLTS